MPITVLKIDLCKSKAFTSSQELTNKHVRPQLLKRLLDTARPIMPEGSKDFPKGSFYKSEGDALYFLIEKPSVALRAATEFMQVWYSRTLEGLPECRVVIDYGDVEQLKEGRSTHLTGKPFENISVIEKSVGDGRIYVSNPVVQHSDKTMFRFRSVSEMTLGGSAVRVLQVDYLDPRTIGDASLIHALFVAHPKATEAREKFLEVILVEYLLKTTSFFNFEQFSVWAKENGYPVPTSEVLEQLLANSPLVAKSPDGALTRYFLSDQQRKDIDKAREEFRSSRRDCQEIVRKAVVTETRSELSVSDIDIGKAIETFLCAIFSEIRLMANYFRSTSEFFVGEDESLRKFDYVLREACKDLPGSSFEAWRRGFIKGLQTVAQQENTYVAAVFHDVLGTYYLNRFSQTSAYQLEKLKQREIYLDTNVLYSLKVKASSHYELCNYFLERGREVGVALKVFPQSVVEYEKSLLDAEREYAKGETTFLLTWNPWIFQEFRANKGRYLGSMAVCRERHSVAKQLPVVEKNYSAIEKELTSVGIALERNYQEYSEEDSQNLWLDIRGEMASNAWDPIKYWDFIYKHNDPEIIHHDMTCLKNCFERASTKSDDELGKKVYFLTLDSKLLRLRKRFSFIISPKQFLEFFLPYLFLADVPLVDAHAFPNKLLAAELGTVIVKSAPTTSDWIAAFLRERDDEWRQERMSREGQEIAKVLNQERFAKIVESAKEVPEGDKQEVAGRLAEVVDAISQAKAAEIFSNESVSKKGERIAELELKVDKLEKTVRYWRKQARREDRR